MGLRILLGYSASENDSVKVPGVYTVKEEVDSFMVDMAEDLAQRFLKSFDHPLKELAEKKKWIWGSGMDLYKRKEWVPNHYGWGLLYRP